MDNQVNSQVTVSGCPSNLLVVCFVEYIIYAYTKIAFGFRFMVVRRTTASVFLVVWQCPATFLVVPGARTDNQNFERWSLRRITERVELLFQTPDSPSSSWMKMVVSPKYCWILPPTGLLSCNTKLSSRSASSSTVISTSTGRSLVPIGNSTVRETGVKSSLLALRGYDVTSLKC